MESDGLNNADYSCTFIRLAHFQRLYQTVVPVIVDFSEMRIHGLEIFNSCCSLITSMDFVVIGIVFVGSTFLAPRIRGL